MVEKKTTSETAEPKAKAVKKPAAPKAVVKASPKKTAAPAAEKKAAPSGKTVTLMQTGSPIGRQGYQRATLIGLGLNKLNKTRTLADTPSIRGMIEKVKHLVKIVEA